MQQLSSSSSTASTDLSSKLPRKISVSDHDGLKAALQDINSSLRLQLADSPSQALARGCFVTLCNQSYIWGLVGLSRALQRVSDRPLICLHDHSLEASGLSLDNVIFVQVPTISHDGFRPGRQEFSLTLSKLWFFGLQSLEKSVFLDVDIGVFSNIDHLFDAPSPSFAPDYVIHAHTQRFNSGVIVLKPEEALFQSICKFAADGNHSYDGGDQGLLNEYYNGDHHILSVQDNTLRHNVFMGPGTTNFDDAPPRVIHYIVKKPWEICHREDIDSLLLPADEKWLDLLEKEDLVKLMKRWFRDVYLHYERPRRAESASLLASLVRKPNSKIERRTRRVMRILLGAAFVSPLFLGIIIGMLIA